MGNPSNQTQDTESQAVTAPPAPAVGPGLPPEGRAKGRKLILSLSILVVLAVVAVVVYRHYAAYESTDDAQIDGYIYPVSSRVPGYVVQVLVDDNQYVEAGTVLVKLDPKDYEVAVSNAKANLANDQASAEATATNIPLTSVNTSTQLSSAQADVDSAEAGLAAAQSGYASAQAGLMQAEANDMKAQDDVNRYKPLAAKDEIPQQRYIQAEDTQKATAAVVEAARAAVASAQQTITQARAKITLAQSQLKYAETRPQQISLQRARAKAAEAVTDSASAKLQQAELNLNYTTIVAPVSGIVGQRSVQSGQNVAPGQQLMNIVPLDSKNIWVTANFKETQLTRMKKGLPVDIFVDTYGRTYQGHVLNIAGASGARFSLLPPENATGNYVKVVQRIPVKIEFDQGQDPEHLLRPGMSVVPSVKVQ